MAQEALPIVLIVGDSADPSLAMRLADTRFRAESCGWTNDPANTPHFSVVIVDGGLDPHQALAWCRSLRTRLGADRPPIVFLAADAVAIRRQAFEHGADACLVRPLAIDELRAQVISLLSWRDTVARMTNRADELQIVHERLTQAYSHINLDLDLARRLQTSFLPRVLPEVGHCRFAVWSRPLGPVGGDFYDVFRLDERHVGFYLADAMGHGVPASLLSVFLKRAVTPKEIQPNGYRLLPPDEVLTGLNRELIEQDLPEQPFVTMVYGLLNCFSGELSMARAAHPLPLYLPAQGPPTTWQIPGTMLGVFEAKYLTEKKTLAHGDRLVLVTDGFASDANEWTARVSGTLSTVIGEIRSLTVTEFTDKLAQKLIGADEPRDDCTILTLDMGH